MPATPEQSPSRAQTILTAIEALPPLPADAVRVTEVAQPEVLGIGPGPRRFVGPRPERTGDCVVIRLRAGKGVAA